MKKSCGTVLKHCPFLRMRDLAWTCCKSVDVKGIRMTACRTMRLHRGVVRKPQ